MMLNYRKILYGGILTAVFIFGIIGAFYAGTQLQSQAQQDMINRVAINQMNADQKQYYDYLKYNSLHKSYASTNSLAECSSQGHRYTCHENYVWEFFSEIFYSAAGHGTEQNKTLIAQGYTPDCISGCTNGINYFMDPTTLITSQGRGIEQCLVFNPSSGTTDTCTNTNRAVYIGWSVSTATPVAGDTYAGGAGVACSSTNLIVDANGLRDVAATSTGGANGATVTTTLAKTFSITGTYTAVQVSCVLSGTGTNADSGTNPLLYAEATFGPDSFVSGDSLTGTWTIART